MKPDDLPLTSEEDPSAQKPMSWVDRFMAEKMLPYRQRNWPQSRRDRLARALDVAPRAIEGDAGRLLKTTDRRSGNTEYEILLNRDLNEVAVPRVTAHEVGHLIDSIAGGIPTERLNRELRAIYNDLNNPQSYGRPFGPEQSGYTKPFVPRELMAEAIRAYMADPNYIKTVAPKVAARIRQYVNQNPQLRDVIQFNMRGVPLPTQPAWDDFVPGYDPETGKWGA